MIALERRMASIKKRFEKDSDKKFQQEPNMRVKKDIYIDCPQHAAFESELAEVFARKA